MDSRKIVLQQTAQIALGEVIGTALMMGVFALLGKFDLSVLFGGIAGCVITVANFFFMAVVAELAADRALKQDVEGGKKLVKTSQTIRYFVLAAVLVLCAISKVFNLLALVVPLLFVRPILLLAEFFRKKVD